MKRNNVQRVLTLLKANYPQSFSKLTPEMGEILPATWEVALSTYEDNVVNAAVCRDNDYGSHQQQHYRATCGHRRRRKCRATGDGTYIA